MTQDERDAALVALIVGGSPEDSAVARAFWDREHPDDRIGAAPPDGPDHCEHCFEGCYRCHPEWFPTRYGGIA